MIRPFDVEELRRFVQNASPFPYFVVDAFLDPDFAGQVHDSLPKFEDALKIGRSFSTVNERGKVQIVDSARFPPAVAALNRALSEPSWTAALSRIFDVPDLLPDDELVGGGIHQTGPRGRLDVHVDFNYIPERQLHRRLNIVIYFNREWKPEWGGRLELWDQSVKQCRRSVEPLFNRCIVFETSEISFHGVTAVNCPPDRARKSFAAYYYTTEPPAHWNGEAHSTIFRSRPDEVIRGRVLMPAEKAARAVRQSYWDFRRAVKRLLIPSGRR